MEFETLDWQVRHGILTLTLNRPDRMNAFTVRMADELELSSSGVIEPLGFRHIGASRFSA